MIKMYGISSALSYPILMLENKAYVVLGRNVANISILPENIRDTDIDKLRKNKDYNILYEYMLEELYTSLPLEET